MDSCNLTQLMQKGPASLDRVTLNRVFNASGMVLDRKGPTRQVITGADWREGDPLPVNWKESEKPSLLTTSSADSGLFIDAPVLPAPKYSELEALTWAGSRLSALFQKGGNVTVGDTERQVILDTPAAEARVGKHRYPIYEGLAHTDGTWYVLMTISRQAKAGDQVRDKMEMYIVTFREETGGLMDVQGPVRHRDGRIVRELGGDLLRLDDGNYIIPGFYDEGLLLVDRSGQVITHVQMKVNRVEGIDLDRDACELLLARECHGTGHTCTEPTVTGTPLWVAGF